MLKFLLMGDTFKIENDSVIISKNNETKIYPFNTVKGACLKVFIQNINKSLQVKYVCKEADKIFKEYGYHSQLPGPPALEIHHSLLLQLEKR